MFVVVAINVQSFAKAAYFAGHCVMAADCFCDRDTRGYAAQFVSLHGNGLSIDREHFINRLLPLLHHDDLCIYGSGFESQPDLLELVSQRCILLGNPPSVITAVKDPKIFFAALKQGHIDHPRWNITPPESGVWLVKGIGGSGGLHIQQYNMQQKDISCYYQELVDGQAYSLLFLADGQNTLDIGYNKLLLSPTVDQPYRYGGVVSKADLTAPIQQAMSSAACCLAATFGLRGLNSLDCMVDAQNRLWVLEVNPRLSASFELYNLPARNSLITAHLAACRGKLIAQASQAYAQACLTCYADCNIMVAPDFVWPDWVVNVPNPGMIMAGSPICSVMAHGENSYAAERIATYRVGCILELIKNNQEF